MTGHPAATIHGVVDRRTMLPAMASGLRVLHLGCVDESFTTARFDTGDLLHQELTRVAADVIGVDISAQGLDELQALVPGRYVLGDAEQLASLELPDDVELVIAAELIEHLGAPSAFYLGLAEYLRRTGARAVLTTPNAYSWRHFLAVALRRPEMVHPDHVLMYSLRTLERALDGCGLVIDRAWVHTWESARSASSRLAALVDRAILRWQPGLAVGLVVEVRPA